MKKTTIKKIGIVFSVLCAMFGMFVCGVSFTTGMDVGFDALLISGTILGIVGCLLYLHNALKIYNNLKGIDQEYC